MGRLDFDDLQKERRYWGQAAYNQAKLANVLVTYELARRLEGTGVTAKCVDPGGIVRRTSAANTGLSERSCLRRSSRRSCELRRREPRPSFTSRPRPRVEGVQVLSPQADEALVAPLVRHRSRRAPLASQRGTDIRPVRRRPRVRASIRVASSHLARKLVLEFVLISARLTATGKGLFALRIGENSADVGHAAAHNREGGVAVGVELEDERASYQLERAGEEKERRACRRERGPA